MAVTVEEYIPRLNERPQWVMTSDKFKATYTVRPTVGGFIFYEIVVDTGSLPAALASMYTNPKRAIEDFQTWEEKQPKSKAVRRDENTEAREAQKAEEAK